MPLRIAISGTHCTGKTTLVKALSQEWGDAVYIIEEAARKLVKNIETEQYYTEDYTLEKQLSSMIFQMMWEEECLRSVESGVRIIIFDRSIVDAWAYMVVLYPEYANSRIGRVIWEMVGARARATYDVYCITEMKAVCLVGAERVRSVEFRREVHDMLIALYQTIKVPICVLEGATENRIRQIHKIISAAGC